MQVNEGEKKNRKGKEENIREGKSRGMQGGKHEYRKDIRM